MIRTMSDSGDMGAAEATTLRRAPCPNCGEPWLRPTQLPGRCAASTACSRFELVSQCPNCGEHQTIARMSHTEDMQCQSCGASMLQAA